MPPSSKSTRLPPRRATGSTSRPRPTARSTAVAAGRHLEDLLRSGRQVHLGAGRGQSRQRLRRHRRQGSHLQDHAPTARARRFYKTNATNVVSLAFAHDGSTDSRHRISRPRVPHRPRRQGVRAAGFALSRDSRAARRCRRHHLRGGHQRRATQRRRGSPRRPPAHRARRGRRCRASRRKSPRSPSWTAP